MEKWEYKRKTKKRVKIINPSTGFCKRCGKIFNKEYKKSKICPFCKIKNGSASDKLVISDEEKEKLHLEVNPIK